MRTLSPSLITHTVRELLFSAEIELPGAVGSAINEAYTHEKNALGRWALGQVLKNHAAARDGLPLCQDTGVITVYAELGEEVYSPGLAEAVQDGVRMAADEGLLRPSLVAEPVFDRRNTGDNTPALVHITLVPGERLRLIVLPKGAGTENRSALALLNPGAGAAGVRDFVQMQTAGLANACPPVVVGIGVGGTADSVLDLAKRALLRPLGLPSPHPRYAALERELLNDINQTGIGPQGFGGACTALAVHIEYAPTHIACLPVGFCVNCHAARMAEVTL